MRWRVVGTAAHHAFVPHFICAQCRQRLTSVLRKVKLPAQVAMPEPRRLDSGLMDRSRRARMDRGTYALLIRPNEFVAEPRGCAVHPDDVPGARQHPDQRTWSGCCGSDGLSGMNLACARCGAAVGTQQSACFTQNQIVLDFTATIADFSDEEAPA